MVFPNYREVVISRFDYVAISLYSAALLVTAGALAVLYAYIRRTGRAHWVGTIGFVLAIASAALAGIGEILEDGFLISSMSEIAYGPGLLALLGGLLIASITTLATRALPVIHGVIFLLGALAFSLFQVGGDVVFGGSWLALGVFFFTSGGQPDLSTARQAA